MNCDFIILSYIIHICKYIGRFYSGEAKTQKRVKRNFSQSFGLGCMIKLLELNGGPLAA